MVIHFINIILIFVDDTSIFTNKREIILRKRRPQLYKSTHGFRLSFCNLTDKEKKDQRASIYRTRTKNMRERDFFSRRQSKFYIFLYF